MTADDVTRPCTVLVCDDQPQLRAAMGEILSVDPRFEVIGQVGDGVSCLEHLGAVTPDVLILDVSLPGGGPDLARAVKLVRPTTFVLVFTASTCPETRAAMLEAGGDEYLVKTGRLRPLLDALARAYEARCMP